MLRVYQDVLDANGNPVLDANGNPVRQLIAQNDDYFSEDSFIGLDLAPGTYYVGDDSPSGNDNYDPTIEDSGIGGTSVGPYDLRLNFRSNADNSIVNADNPGLTPTRLDGDTDGVFLAACTTSGSARAEYDLCGQD